ncbi:MAG: hypothetical protein WCL08_05655 [Verrucomicrobiota bacterium]
MNILSRRMDRLESKAPPTVKTWARVIWNPFVETEAEARARDLPPGFEGKVILRKIITPAPRAEGTTDHE